MLMVGLVTMVFLLRSGHRKPKGHARIEIFHDHGHANEIVPTGLAPKKQPDGKQRGRFQAPKLTSTPEF
jgi:hypothetical protein